MFSCHVFQFLCIVPLFLILSVISLLHFQIGRDICSLFHEKFMCPQLSKDLKIQNNATTNEVSELLISLLLRISFCNNVSYICVNWCVNIIRISIELDLDYMFRSNALYNAQGKILLLTIHFCSQLCIYLRSTIVQLTTDTRLLPHTFIAAVT